MVSAVLCRIFTGGSCQNKADVVTAEAEGVFQSRRSRLDVAMGTGPD